VLFIDLFTRLLGQENLAPKIFCIALIAAAVTVVAT
jgi:hypothetical protein